MTKKISDLIKEAILSGNSRKGVSRVAIIKYISSKRTLSAPTIRSIGVVLKNFTQLGKITKKKASYVVSKTWKNKTKKKKSKITKKTKKMKPKSIKRTKVKKVTKKPKVKKATKVKSKPAKKKPTKKTPKRTPKKNPKPKPVAKRASPKTTVPDAPASDAPIAKRRAEPKPKAKARNEESKASSDKPLKFDFDKSAVPVLAAPKLSYKWQYYDQKKAGGPWHDYDYGSSDLVEEAYQAWSANPAVDVAKVFSGEWHYMIDFNSMQQTNLDYNTHTVRKIRRVKA